MSFLCIVFEEASDIPQCEKRTGIEPKISRAQYNTILVFVGDCCENFVILISDYSVCSRSDILCERYTISQLLCMERIVWIFYAHSFLKFLYKSVFAISTNSRKTASSSKWL